MRCITLISLVLFFSITMVKNGYGQEKISITKVVIDAGHGGKDPGTVGKKSQEKNIALRIALNLADNIRSQFPDVTVTCTRTTDEFIELHERAEIANRSKADLFISIHCNANPKHNFQGAETYVMGLHRTAANLEIAKLENAAILMEPDYSTNYNGFDPNSDESYITFTLFQNAYLIQSTTFASFVQDEMKDRVGMDDRGVRQAGFLVLYKTTMPSVLIETGFLSNLDEEKFLNSTKGQEYISGAICRAFKRFKVKMENNGKEMAALTRQENSQSAVKENSPPQKKETNRNENIREVKKPAKDSVLPSGIPKENPPLKDTNKPKLKPGVQPSDKDNITLKQSPDKSAQPKEPPKSKTKQTGEAPRKDTLKPKEEIAAKTRKPEIPVEKPAVKPAVKVKEAPGAKQTIAGRVVFRVQVAASTKELSIKSDKFDGLPEVWKYNHQGLYKYTIGEKTSLEEIGPLLDMAKNKGFPDAFIVAFQGDQRITVAEAKKILSGTDESK